MTALSRLQSILLGAVVLGCVSAAGAGLAAVAAKQGLWAGTVPVSVALADADDVRPPLSVLHDPEMQPVPI